MGMFDSIEVNCLLPLPLEVVDKIYDYFELEFQTKDLECFLEKFIISEDGSLMFLKQDRRWVDDDESFLKGYMKVESENLIDSNFHGLLTFYAYERLKTGEDKGEDISLTYVAKFTNGKCEQLELESFDIIDASESIKNTNDFFKEIEIKKKKWYNKYIFYSKPYIFSKNLIVKGLYNLQHYINSLRFFIIKYF